MVEIRKSRREESLLKKRRDGLPAAAAAAAAASPLLAHSSALQQKVCICPDLARFFGLGGGLSIWRFRIWFSDPLCGCVCSWRGCRRWCRRCSPTTAPCSWRPPRSSGSCSPSVRFRSPLSGPRDLDGCLLYHSLTFYYTGLILLRTRPALDSFVDDHDMLV